MLHDLDRVIADDSPFRCPDRLIRHRREFFSFLKQRWAGFGFAGDVCDPNAPALGDSVLGFGEGAQVVRRQIS